MYQYDETMTQIPPDFPKSSTAVKVLQALVDCGAFNDTESGMCPPVRWVEEKTGEVHHGAGWEYRFNPPWREGADSFAGALLVHDESGEKGAFRDFRDEFYQGSLYELALQLGVEVPEKQRRKIKEFANLAEYAEYKNVPVDVFIRAGYQDDMRICPKTKEPRRCITFPTRNGIRVRFIDGNVPKFMNPKGFKTCWYGLARAVQLAIKYGIPLVLVNGEPSVICAQYWGIPAFSVAGGTESNTLTRELLDELRTIYPQGRIITALDCDSRGRTASAAKSAQLRREGWDSLSVDFGSEVVGFDMADFGAMHTDQTQVHLEHLVKAAERILEAGVSSETEDPSILSPLHVERQTLAIFLFHPDKITECGGTWRDTWYSSDQHRTLARILRAMAANTQAIDHLTVWQKICELHKQSLFGSQKALEQWRIEGMDADHLSEYLNIIQDATLRRQWLQATFELQRAARDPNVPVEELSARANLALVTTSDGMETGPKLITMEQALNDAWNKLSGDMSPVLFMNILPIDRALEGFVDGDLITMSGRPGSGKTALAIAAALEFALQGQPVLIFSQEVSVFEITARLVSCAIESPNFWKMFGTLNLVSIPYKSIVKNRMTVEQLAQFAELVSLIIQLPIVIAYGRKSLRDIEHLTRLYYEQTGVPCIPVVDYVQYMLWPEGKKQDNEAIAANIYGLKALADSEYARFVVCCSQMNRSIEGRKDADSLMSDVEGSGKIEQASTVMLNFLPLTEDELQQDVARLVIKVPKSRNGAVGLFAVGYDRAHGSFRGLGSEWSSEA